MTLRNIALAFGIVFLAIGVLGFVPGITDGEMLLGIFHVNAAHNFVHILTGLVALGCARSSAAAAQLFFRIFGMIYGLVAVFGFMVQDGLIFGLISNNTADTWLHVAVAATSLYLGFGYHRRLEAAAV